MLVKDFIKKLEEKVPLFLQEEYDNSGIQIDGPNVNLDGLLVTLDVTEEAVSRAIGSGCQLVLSHHPLFFKGIKRITPLDVKGRIIYTSVMNGMTVYSAHTNYDSVEGGINDVLSKKLGFKDPKPLVPGRTEGSGIGRIGEVDEIEIRDFSKLVKNSLELSHIQFAPKGPHFVRKAAICSGSGADFIDDAVAAGADVYITGDVSYHEMIKAVDSGMSMIVVGHDESEKFFEDEMIEFAESLGLKAFKHHEKFYRTI